MSDPENEPEECISCEDHEAVEVVLVPSTGFKLYLCQGCATEIKGSRSPEKPAQDKASLEAYLKRHVKVVEKLRQKWSIRRIASDPGIKVSEGTVLKVSKAMKQVAEMNKSGWAPPAPAAAPKPAPKPEPRPAPKPVPPPKPAPEPEPEEEEPEPEYDYDAIGRRFIKRPPPPPNPPDGDDPMSVQVSTGVFPDGTPIPRGFPRDPLATLPAASADGSPVPFRDFVPNSASYSGDFHERVEACMAYHHMTTGSVPYDLVRKLVGGPKKDSPYQMYVFDTGRQGVRNDDGSLLKHPIFELGAVPKHFTRHPVLPAGVCGKDPVREPAPTPPPEYFAAIARPERTTPYTPEEMGIYDDGPEPEPAPEPVPSEDDDDDGLGTED